GFGSMPAEDTKKQTQIVIDALRKSCQRGLLATGWGGLAEVANSDAIHVLDAAPHDWLFPRCAAVVHHGGAGTTHEGLRWGRPMIICPLAVDQPYWGRRVMEIGAGPKPIPQKHLNREDLTAALEAVKDPVMIARAEKLGVAMRAEGGAEEAARVVETAVGQT
ncbi:MAG: glycosyltransferase, partial [Hyphomicrobium sp.]